MESSYFPKPEFQKALGAYARVQLNSKGTEAERATFQRYGGGKSLPRYLVLEADGTLVAATGWTGGTDPGSVLLAWLRQHAR